MRVTDVAGITRSAPPLKYTALTRMARTMGSLTVSSLSRLVILPLVRSLTHSLIGPAVGGRLSARAPKPVCRAVT